MLLARSFVSVGKQEAARKELGLTTACFVCFFVPCESFCSDFCLTVLTSKVGWVLLLPLLCSMVWCRAVRCGVYCLAASNGWFCYVSPRQRSEVELRDTVVVLWDIWISVTCHLLTLLLHSSVYHLAIYCILDYSGGTCYATAILHANVPIETRLAATHLPYLIELILPHLTP